MILSPPRQRAVQGAWADHTRIRPAFDAGDHMFLNDEGTRAMVAAVDLTAPDLRPRVTA